MIIATGTSRTALDWTNRDVTWGGLVKRLSHTTYTDETMAQYADMNKDRRVMAKDVGGMVGGELEGKQRKNSALKNRCILALDIDYGTADTWDDITMLCDWECIMHTTHSHTPEHPRYRLYFPLTAPITKDKYAPLGRMVASMINIELFDDTTYEASRLMFWPSTCKDGEYKVWHQEGEWLNPDDILNMYTDWHDESTWPVSSRMQKITHKTIKDKQADPTLKQGIVGAFCKVYSVPDAIDKFLPDIYLHTEEADRYTYANGTTAKGLKIFDDGLFAQSWHDSDPAHGRLCNAFDLVRLHKFPDIDERKSFDAMRRMLDSDKAVQDELDHMIFQGNVFNDDFDDGDDLKRLKIDLTETGNALRLKDRYGEYMCYNPSLKWCCWNGVRWETNADSLAIRNVMRLNDLFREWAVREVEKARPENVDKMKKTDYPEDYSKALAIYDWAKASRNWVKISNTLHAARGTMQDVGTERFDSDPWDLNTPLGIVNLKTGEIMPHAAAHRCTMITNVSPNWSTSHEKWDAFLDLITCGDKELQKFLQQVAGMALVGETYEECIVMCYGNGANGKSTLFKIWSDIMGDYAGTIRNEVILGNRWGTEVTGADQLRGMRLVIASELENQQSMSNALLKKLTSRDEINANVKYAKAISFRPTHTLVIHTNHLPRLKSVDYGTIRRVIIVPFKAQIQKKNRKNDFAEELIREEGPAVLAWMIDGAVRFYGNNMTVERPETVRLASETYLENEDTLNRFMTECCIHQDESIEPDKRPRLYLTILYREFKQWCEDEGLFCSLGRNKFRLEIEAKKGITFIRDMKGLYTLDMVLADEEDDVL